MLADLQRVDSGAANLVELHGQATETLRELAIRRFRTMPTKWDVDPVRLAELEERLNLTAHARAQIRREPPEPLRLATKGQNEVAGAGIPAMRNWPVSMPRWKNLPPKF